jgi:hypothetical protein
MISMFVLYTEKPVAFGNPVFSVSLPYVRKLTTGLKLKSPALCARLFAVAGARFELATFGL